MSIHYKVESESNGSRITVIMQDVLENYIDSSNGSTQLLKMKKMMENFVKGEYLIEVNESISEAQKIGKALANEKIKMEKERTSLEKKINTDNNNIIEIKAKKDSNLKRIEELKEKIAGLESELIEKNKNIEVNTAKKEETKKSIEKQKEAIEMQQNKIQKLNTLKENFLHLI